MSEQGNSSSTPFAQGRCTCGQLRYELLTTPMFVNCCHCRWCQRETGAAFALNALIEADRVTLTAGRAEPVVTPSASGKGQIIHRCPMCHVAVWSNYAGAGELLNFIRVGTLDNPDLLPPDIHIFTSSKQPWVALDGTIPVMLGYYPRESYWPAASVARHRSMRGLD